MAPALNRYRHDIVTPQVVLQPVGARPLAMVFPGCLGVGALAKDGLFHIDPQHDLTAAAGGVVVLTVLQSAGHQEQTGNRAGMRSCHTLVPTAGQLPR